MKFVIYRRVSTKAQEKSGLGLEAQTRDIDLFLNNYTQDGVVVKEFVETKSGKGELKDRPVLQEAVEFCEMNGYTLLVAKLDRLSRDVETIAHLIKRIDFKVAVMPNADKMQLQIYAVLAEQERDFIAQRTKAALAVAKEKGTKLGCPEKNHKDVGKRSKKAAQEYLEQIQHHIIDLINKGVSTTQMAVQLNLNGVLTRFGNQWTQSTICRYIKQFDLREVARNEPKPKLMLH